MHSCLYNCRVFHKRFAPVEHGFVARTFMWHIDLDELDGLCRRLTLLSRNRANVYSFRDDDHLYLGRDNIRDNIAAYLSRNGVDEPLGRVSLLTNLRTMGHVFNPVSFYFCHDAQEQPLAVVVEVHNTFGELKPYLLTREDLQRTRFERRHPKLFYISPFSELDRILEIKAELPSGHLALHVNAYEKGAATPFFRSSLTGRSVPLTNAALLRYSLRFPFITLKVVTLIHWHALRLYLKKVPYHPKKADPHLQTGILPKKHQTASAP